jgi:uracil-DNA glycosylase family protein
MRRTSRRTKAEQSRAPVPTGASFADVRRAARGCRACDLWKLGTQTVFGEGPVNARLVIVGEQPGDQEDKEGRPFAGPSGALLDTGLQAAGISRAHVYVTNAVKHFKWARVGRSPRRLHQKPNAGEVRACNPWLESELAHIKPDVVLCLGATAAQAMLGRSFRVTTQRGVPIPSPMADVQTFFATVHPSSVLRAPNPAARKQAEKDFFHDLTRVAAYLKA